MDAVTLSAARAQGDRRYKRPTVVMIGAGIDPTGATDSTAAIQAKLNSLPASGGDAVFPAGTFAITSLTCSVPVTITGAGGSPVGDGSLSPVRAITTLVVNATTGDALTLAGLGTTLRDFAIVNDTATTPTAGTGLKMTGASQGTLNGVTVVGFWNNAQFNGVYWTVTGCHFYDPVNYGVYMPTYAALYNDHGDMGFSNTVISTMYKNYNAAAMVRWESGGGLRMTGCKINGGFQPGMNVAWSPRPQVGLDIMTADGVSTGCFLISGCSISAATTAQIRLGQSGASRTGLITNITIVGNDISVGFGTGVGVMLGLDNNAPAYSKVINVLIANNNFGSLVNSISGGGVAGLLIGPNSHQTISGALINLTSYNGTTRYMMSSQECNAASQVIYSANRSLDQQTPQFDNIVFDYCQPVQLTTAGTWVEVFNVTGAQGSTRGGSMIVDIEVTGYNDTIGPVVFRGTRALTWGSTGGLTITTMGTDQTTGAGLFDARITNPSGVKGAIQVQTLAGAANGNINGIARCIARGEISNYARG